MIDVKYPIGHYEPVPYQEEIKRQWLADIAQLPNLLEASIENLDAAQLATPYRDGGWTAAQVVHHLADSHINFFCRTKLTLTENNPLIKAYDEVSWINQPDAEILPINNATTLLHALHQRIYLLFKHATTEDWERMYTHSESGEHSLWYLLGMYAWHGRHHVAHINSLRERMGWR